MFEVAFSVLSVPVSISIRVSLLFSVAKWECFSILPEVFPDLFSLMPRREHWYHPLGVFGEKLKLCFLILLWLKKD